MFAARHKAQSEARLVEDKVRRDEQDHSYVIQEEVNEGVSDVADAFGIQDQ